MQKSLSLEKVNGTEVVISNARKPNLFHQSYGLRKRKGRVCSNIFEEYCITIKPKLHRSNSLSDLNTNSDFTTNYLLNRKINPDENRRDLIYGSAGDATLNYHRNSLDKQTYMPWNSKGRKHKKKGMSPETYNSKYPYDYMNNIRDVANENISSCAENSSVCSTDQEGFQKAEAFPFKHTPSGYLKVQSNQVVFQSSTVGVLLADPTQAKVKVKFEGKAAGEPDDDTSENFENDNEPEPLLRFGNRENIQVRNADVKTRVRNSKSVSSKDEKGKDLASLGYTTSEPIDWMRVQLPKKQDLFQEFYRRVHNFINTDAVVRIDNNELRCHQIVLQVYSSFFDANVNKEIDLPSSKVTPEAFRSIYEWMVYNGCESNKVLKRENILDIFCAAQYLSIKDLEDQCRAFILNENLFCEDTAFALFREAKLKGMTPVVDIMVPRVMRFFLPLVASKDFLDLDHEEVMIFLKSNYICVTSEMEVLMAGVRWLHGDWSSRRHYAIEIMRCVRFGLISPWQLVDIKRNPDNSEILEIVNEPEVQQMVDDGLAYVIIKYWYGNNSKNYYHWIDVLGLTEPAERNWIGDEKNHVTYKDFLKYLEQFMVPRDQMYQQMAMMQPPRRSEDLPGSLRGMDNDKMEMRRPKMDFPLPATLKGLANVKDDFPTMSEFFESRRKMKEGSQSPSPVRSPPVDLEIPELTDRRNAQAEKRPREMKAPVGNQQQVQMFELPEKESVLNSESSSVTTESSATTRENYGNEKRHSIAASYLASATAALGYKRNSQAPSASRGRTSTNVTRQETAPSTVAPAAPNNVNTPQISLFNQSKDSIARITMNKLSASILGPANKKYVAEGSLFDWDRETVLVFGGIDPHTTYGVGKNTGKEIYRFDPVSNVWDNVGNLPEPRHHHSIAFLRGRVYLVGGADPRDDDLRGKSVVVSTVWSFEPVTRAWYSENGLSTPRKNFGLIVHKMALYAIGGQDKKGKVLRSVEKFDPKSGSWSEVRPMNVARMAMGCLKYRDYIWVAGGMTGDKKRPVSKIVECYNSRTNEWTEIHNLRFPRCFTTLFSMNDKLYIVGGAGKISEKEKTPSSVGAIDAWDWKERAWKLETEMSMPRHGHALAYLGTQLIIIGGVTTIYMRALNNVESYCCERGAWIRGVAALPSPLSGHGAVTLPPASLM
ncbi:uncharacterized protein LOC101738452 isoform X2 [Bombyx mori]|uniref:uncharacterized protein LOC101738452 isoform X2 n=1 Tax=Bombyx mori TaxID=7091 RepID=UPI002ED16E40